MYDYKRVATLHLKTKYFRNKAKKDSVFEWICICAQQWDSSLVSTVKLSNETSTFGLLFNRANTADYSHQWCSSYMCMLSAAVFALMILPNMEDKTFDQLCC